MFVWLGATRGRVIRMVGARGARVVAAGVLLGAPVAFWSARIASHVVENLVTSGFIPIATSSAGLIVVAIAAVYVPVRRATRVEPVVALRAE